MSDDDGIALFSAAHPRPKLSFWTWLRSFWTAEPDLNLEALEDVVIDIPAQVIVSVVNEPELLQIHVHTVAPGEVSDSISFDYDHPADRCYGTALDRAVAEANRIMEEYEDRGFYVEIREEY